MSRERTKDVLVTAAVLGLLAGAAACGGARAATAVPAADPHAATATDKNACGNHPGSACGAVTTPAPAASATPR